MADVFISYSREDRATAEAMARALAGQGLDVFWDSEIPPGQTWADYIEGKLSQCKAAIVLWSQHSAKSQWVREEARMARDKAKLFPVMIDGTAAPFGFGEVQAANLVGWTGDPNHPEWARLSNAVRAAVGAVGAAPQATPQPQPQAAWSAPPPPAPQGAWSAPQPHQSQQQGWQQQQQQGWAGGAQAQAGAAETLSPLGYVQKCFRLYANGKGRARRAEYGWFVVAMFIIVFVAAIIDVVAFGMNPYTNSANLPLFSGLFSLALIAPAISVAARRAHDFGQSGWLAILTAIPYLGALAALAFIFIPGQPGANAHGPNPKGV
ncbi:MAG: DUF805 domain-containing protein [Hyphomonadaceae bacterium]|nr:DUF805 domain-containing protein [Hyphomonadaceae bacterium]MBX3510917.1 DUF805 domain-containing protein [Hyphomonadaceae bacterium]